MEAGSSPTTVLFPGLYPTPAAQSGPSLLGSLVLRGLCRPAAPRTRVALALGVRTGLLPAPEGRGASLLREPGQCPSLPAPPVCAPATWPEQRWAALCPSSLCEGGSEDRTLAQGCQRCALDLPRKYGSARPAEGTAESSCPRRGHPLPLPCSRGSPCWSRDTLSLPTRRQASTGKCGTAEGV